MVESKGKEIWFDITKEIDWNNFSRQGNGFWLIGMYDFQPWFYFNGSELRFNRHTAEKANFEIRIEKGKSMVFDNNFRILKKEKL